MKKYLICILLTLLSLNTLYAQLSEQSEVWLVSCTPGIPAWAHYGHTAIRIYEPQQPEPFDLYFNYGIFDFYQPHFYSKFVKGQTDYMLGVENATSFYSDYELTGRKMYMQKLNLTLEERNRIFTRLAINARPENRSYRYNFVFDNCATRPYEIVRDAIGKPFITPEFDKRTDTFRERISYYSGRNTWGDCGINLAFGRDADKEMKPLERLFLPEELMDYMQEATIIEDDGTIRKLVSQSDIQPFIPRDSSWLGSPSFTLILIILLIISITIRDVHRKQISWWLDAILFLIYALLGSILAFLALWSEHPFVSENANLLFYSPLMFVPFVMCLFPKGRYWLQKADLVFGIYILLALPIYLASGQEFHILVWVTIVHALRLRFTWYGNIFLIGHKAVKHLKRTAPIVAMLLLSSVSYAQQSRLTVVIMVDGLNQQALQQMSSTMQPGGLRTIIDEGNRARVYFPQLVNGGCETVATITTGTTPYYHGIAADTRFDRLTQNILPILQDNQYNGIGSQLHYSPKALLSPSLTDIFRLNNGKESRIYAIGINAANTILLAGHAANACMWLESTDNQPHWATTNYYPMGLHPLADLMNTDGTMLSLYNQKWTNQMALADYLHRTPTEERKNGFAYSCNKADHNYTTAPLQNMPAANSMVINLACEIQERERLGEGLQNDMLLLELTCRTPFAQSDYLESAEQQDMYMCLNQSLDMLIKQLFRRVGSQGMRLIFIGKPEIGHSTEALQDARLPYGTFNVAQAAALLNTYLMAIYGNGKYVIGGHNNSIYINYPLLQQQKINTNHLVQLATQFLLEFEGVQSVYTASQIPLLQGSGREVDGKLRRTFNKECFGDIMFTFQPGYRIINSDATTDQISDNDPEVPIFILGKTLNIPASIAATQIMSIIINE